MQDAVEAAYQEIRTGIRLGRYERGQHLVGEELAARIGVSRTPVREALRRLHGEGLVELTSNRGARVVGWTQADLREVFSLRVLLESYAAEQATSRLSEIEIDEIEAIADELHGLAVSRPPDFAPRFLAGNARLHGIIVEASGNRRLAAMLASIVEASLSVHALMSYGDEDLLRSTGHHRELAAAFRARDANWAAAVARSHLLSAMNAITSGKPVDERTRSP